jgi:hypothetical protein
MEGSRSTGQSPQWAVVPVEEEVEEEEYYFYKLHLIHFLRHSLLPPFSIKEHPVVFSAMVYEHLTHVTSHGRAVQKFQAGPLITFWRGLTAKH